MDTLNPDPRPTRGVTRRDLLKGGLVAEATLSAEPVLAPPALRAQPPKRGGSRT